MGRTKVLWGIIILLIVINGSTLFYFVNNQNQDLPTLGQQGNAAKVGDEWITVEDVLTQLLDYYGEEILDDLISRKVVFQEAERLGVTVSDEEIERELRHFRHGYDSDELFAEALMKQVGITEEQLREEIRYYLLIEELATKDIVITDEEIEEYYEENTDAFYEPTRFHLHRIIVDTEAEAKEAIKEIEEGSSFEAVAVERSIDMITSSSGGDLGVVTSNDYFIDYDVIQTAETIEIGTISEPIETVDGYVIIKVTEREEGYQAPLEEVRETIRREIALKQVEDLSIFLEQLKNQAGVERYMFNQNES